ncbi:hypothetical protein [Vulcanisaeta souniana]|nr:hypothetical protein [Vulcanisaeta souniana]GGI82115.1 hypothetical protein GCM10007112_18570 [Vulcanisaeta souniana JCM 11219]
MALADLVLEGLTLVLAVALGLVLISGLAYLTITVSTANNARLVYAGTYIYLPGTTYINGTLYVPMYNIGYQQVWVRYIYVMDSHGSLHRYASNLVLGVNQYYVYAVNLDYEPTSVTVLVAPINYPKLIKEFSANVSLVSPITLVSQAQSAGTGLVKVEVNDPYGANWKVSWSYADQSYSVSQDQSYSWFINPPYVPIQVSFSALITQNPSVNGINYTCQIVPSQVNGNYGAGSTVTFNVECNTLYYVIVELYAPCNNWYWITATTDYGSWSVGGKGSPKTYTVYYTPNNGGLGWLKFQAGADALAFLGGSLSVYNLSAPGDPLINYTTSWYNVGGPAGTDYFQPLIEWTLPGMVYKAVYSSTGCASSAPPPQPSNSITVTVSDPYGAGWSVSWSGGASGSKSGSSTTQWTITASSTVNFQASITSVPSNYSSCSINPTSTSASPGGSVTFTVSCATNQPSPPKTVYGCFFTLSVGSSPSGASSGVSSSPSSGTYFVQSGSSLSGSISAQSSVSSSSSGSGQSWYQFDDWSLSFSGSGTFYWNGVQVSSGTSWNYGRTFGSFIYDCPSGLTQNVTASFTATANYVYDYITLSGPASVSLNPGSSTTTATYTLSWSIWPYNAYQVAWSLPQTGNSYEVEAQLSTSGGSYTIYWTTNLQCSAGTLLSASESISPSSASVSGSSGSTTATVTITYTCSSIRGP